MRHSGAAGEVVAGFGELKWPHALTGLPFWQDSCCALRPAVAVSWSGVVDVTLPGLISVPKPLRTCTDVALINLQSPFACVHVHEWESIADDLTWDDTRQRKGRKALYMGSIPIVPSNPCACWCARRADGTWLRDHSVTEARRPPRRPDRSVHMGRRAGCLDPRRRSSRRRVGLRTTDRTRRCARSQLGERLVRCGRPIGRRRRTDCGERQWRRSVPDAQPDTRWCHRLRVQRHRRSRMAARGPDRRLHRRADPGRGPHLARRRCRADVDARRAPVEPGTVR